MRLSNVTRRYGEKTVLAGFSLKIPDNGITAIMGPSGCGKTTIMRLLAQLDQPDEGTVYGVPKNKAVLFEDDQLFPWMDVLGNIMLTCPDEGLAVRMLGWLGLANEIHAKLGQISGGQRRRVAIARALTFPADLLLLDEPTQRLDFATASSVMQLVRQAWADKPVVVITHDHEIAGMCDYLVNLHPDSNGICRLV